MKKNITLRELRKKLNEIDNNDSQLDNPLIVLYPYMDAEVSSITKLRGNLYYLSDDDPAELYTKQQLQEDQGMTRKEVDELEPYIKKGTLVLKARE